MAISFIIRAGLVAGAIYYSREIGVWGNAEETEELYYKIQSDLGPHVAKLKKPLPFEVPAMPQTGEIGFLTKHYYNQGVKGTVHFIEMAPCYVGRLAHKTQSVVNESMVPKVKELLNIK